MRTIFIHKPVPLEYSRIKSKVSCMDESSYLLSCDIAISAYARVRLSQPPCDEPSQLMLAVVGGPGEHYLGICSRRRPAKNCSCALQNARPGSRSLYYTYLSGVM